MSTHARPPGRLRGGLSYVWGQVHDRLHLSRRRDALVHLGRQVLGGLIGSVIGLGVVTLWLRYR